jgi:cytosine/uracil/thiamine/allantoin permease
MMAESCGKKPLSRLESIAALLGAVNILGLFIALVWLWSWLDVHDPPSEARERTAAEVHDRGLLMARVLGLWCGLPLSIPGLAALVTNWRKLRWGFRLPLLVPVVMVAFAAAVYAYLSAVYALLPG